MREWKLCWFGKEGEYDPRSPYFVRDFVCSEGGRLQGEEHCTEEVENYFGVVADEYAPRIGIQQKNDGQHTKAVMIRSKEYKYII